MSGEKKTPFARFLSVAPDSSGPVTRYGSRDTIGAVRDPATGEVRLDPSVIIALSQAEADAYRREYNRAVRDKALCERSEADYIAFLDADRAVVEAARSEADKAPAGKKGKKEQPQ